MLFNKPYLLVLFILALGSSCNSDKEKKTVTEEETYHSRMKNIEYKVVSEKASDELKITNIHFDTVSLHNDAKGLLVTFTIQASSKAFDSVDFHGFDSYFIDLKCQSDEGKVYSHRNEIFKTADKKKFMHSHKGCFISEATDRNLEISFPYRMLEMKEGDHELLIYIEAFPSKFKNDSSSLTVKMLEHISRDPKISISMKIKVKAPKLYKTSFTVHKFKLNTNVVDPKKFDFAMGGSGYPDLFWEIYCGSDYIYFSPVEKNKIEYNKKYSSPSFYCTKEDVINLAVVDYDNGPFNTQDDVIERWMGRIETLPVGRTDTLQFGNLEYLIFETTVE